jgi:signal transduction histidine kinase
MPLRFHRNSLATQASLAVVLLSLVLVVLATAWQLHSDYRQEVARTEQQISSLESSVVNVITRSLWIYDNDQLRIIVEGMKTLPYVSYAAIHSEEGLLIERGQPAKDKIGRSVLVYPPGKTRSPLGRLTIESDRSLIRDIVFQRAQSILWTNFILIMLIACVSTLIFHTKVSKPLIGLSQHALQIQMNSQSNPISPCLLQEEHELGQVYRAIDTMQRNIQRDFQTILHAESELEVYRKNLEKLVKERTDKLIQTTKNLVDSSRKAGMAEVAIGVLHNIGNALTGANVKVQNLSVLFQNESTLPHLKNIVELLKEQGPDLSRFLSEDERGQKVLPFLEVLTEELHLQHENSRQIITLLRRDLSTVSQLISKQQSHAKFTGLIEKVIVECIEDILSLQAHEIDKYGVKIQKHFQPGITLTTDRHKLLQILTNLVSNAIQATHKNKEERKLLITLNQQSEQIIFSVTDNGIGISNDQMDKIFRYGYTTKKSGHGFGLHSCSIDAKLLGGNLTCQSAGLGQGACFTLTLPLNGNLRTSNPDEELLQDLQGEPHHQAS